MATVSSARGVAALSALPALPRSGRRARSVVPCLCGCGLGTKSTWHPGHDGRATGWAVRVERGLMTLADVPSNERAGAEFMIARRAAAVARQA